MDSDQPTNDESFELAKITKDRLQIDMPGFAQVPEEEREFFTLYLERLRFGPMATSTIDCTAGECKFWQKCPYNLRNLEPPLGGECPVEAFLIKLWSSDLADELAIDGKSGIDLSLVQKVAKSRLFSKRAEEILAQDGFIMRSYRGVDTQGNALFEYKLHPLINLIEKSFKMEDTILKRLIATRESKHNAQLTGVRTLADMMSQLNAKVKNKIAEQKVVEALDVGDNTI